MQIFHYRRRDRQPNFGDELNGWLWQRLIPNVLNNGDQRSVLVGIGTLINAALPERVRGFERVLLFSTGVGYEQPLKRIPDHWRIYAVRGPRSARQLGLPETLAIADGGLLLRQVYTPHQPKRYRVSWMPHIHHANFAAALFQQACDQLGWGYIDPRAPVETVLTRIDQSEVLIAEAMHGAIAADVLRVPWIPVVTSPRVLSFKWHDWCESMGLTYLPYALPPVADYPQYARGVRSTVKAGLHGWDCMKSRLGLPQAFDLVHHRHPLDQLVNRLSRLGQAAPQLSSMTRFNHKLERLDQKLYNLCQDLDRDLYHQPVPANAEKR